MNLLFIYDPPGVGKLTVANELAKLTNYKLFHNHLTVDLVHSVFEFGTKPFIELREKIWIVVFRKADEESIEGLIFIFSPEASVPDYFIPDLVKLIENNQNKILFVELTCDPEELRKRIVNPSRSRYSKTMETDVEKFYGRDWMIPDIVHERKLTIDNTNINPETTAKKIVDHFQLKKVYLVESSKKVGENQPRSG